MNEQARRRNALGRSEGAKRDHQEQHQRVDLRDRLRSLGEVSQRGSEENTDRVNERRQIAERPEHVEILEQLEPRNQHSCTAPDVRSRDRLARTVRDEAGFEAAPPRDLVERHEAIADRQLRILRSAVSEQTSHGRANSSRRQGRRQCSSGR